LVTRRIVGRFKFNSIAVVEKQKEYHQYNFLRTAETRIRNGAAECDGQECGHASCKPGENHILK
jgi:hypothetical protein